jgi:hypothetical protein
MSKHRSDLERLCRKLRERYGVDDTLTLQVQHDLDVQVVEEGKNSKWLMPYFEFIKGIANTPFDSKAVDRR